MRAFGVAISHLRILLYAVVEKHRNVSNILSRLCHTMTVAGQAATTNINGTVTQLLYNWPGPANPKILK